MKKIMLMVVLLCFGYAMAGCNANPTASPDQSKTKSSDKGKSQSTSNKKGVNFTTVYEYNPISPGAPMNPYNSKGNIYRSFDEMYLAWSADLATDLDKAYPGLAKKWEKSKDGTEVTVMLQPDAKWSNGKPVTTDDVKTSMAIAYTQGNAQSFFLGSVEKKSDKKMVFKQVPGHHYNKFMPDLLQSIIVPSFEYGKLLPDDIWDIIDQSQYSGKDKDKKAKAKKAQGELTKIGKKITKFSPKKDISAGPFVIKNINPGAAYLVKNPHFYAADKVKVDSVTMRNYTGNQQIWNYLIAGQLDAGPFTAMPQNTLNKILKTKGNKKIVTPHYVAATLAFDQKKSPYGKPEVRKAISHILDHKAIQKVAEPVVGTVPEYTTGMIDDVAKDMLTKDDLSKMEKETYDKKKATKLLKKAGFKKKGGKWMMPNGKPWKITLYTVKGFNDWIQAAKVISTELTSFGIPTDPKIISSFALYQEEQQKEKYPVSFWLTALGPSMYSTYSRLYGEPDGYNVEGGELVRKDDKNWLNMPEEIKLPDGSKVNPGKLNYKLNNLEPEEQKPVVRKLALATNANTPVVKLWNYIDVKFVNNTRFTNFPTEDGILNNSPGVWMAMGYVEPK